MFGFFVFEILMFLFMVFSSVKILCFCMVCSSCLWKMKKVVFIEVLFIG